MTSPFINPEFHRQLWCKISALKLVAAPLLVALSFYILYRINAAGVMFSAVVSYQNITSGGLFVFTVLACLWGAHEAGDALRDDVKSNTWDFQKMSPLSPWALFFGKFFGSLSFIWYFSLLVLGVTAVFFAQAGGSVYWLLLFSILSALLAQSISFMQGIESMRHLQGQKQKSDKKIWNALLGILAGYAAMQSTVITYFPVLSTDMAIKWFDMFIDRRMFYLATLLALIGFVLLASYRGIRRELMYRQTPIMWAIFSLCLAVYAAGLSLPNRHFLTAFAVFFALSYVTLLKEASFLPDQLSKFSLFIRAREWNKAATFIPKCLASALYLPFVFLLALGTVSEATQGSMAISVMSGMFFFALRDALAFYAIAQKARTQNTGFYLVVYLLLAYVLLPFLYTTFLPTQQVLLDALNLDNQSLRYFFPSIKSTAWESALPPLMEAAAFAALIFGMRRKNLK